MNTPLALRRLGVGAVAAVTLGAGLPVLLSTTASAQDAPGGSGTAPGQVFQAQASATPTATISPSATPTATMSPTATPTATMSASPSASATPTATTSTSPSASPSATRSPGGGNQPTAPPGCARAAEVMLRRTTINATGSAPLSATATPNSVVEVFAYTRPSTQFRLVRTGTTDNNGNVTFTDVRPPANTRLQARQRGCAFGTQKVLNVRTQISLNAVRNGKQNYTFSGRLLPARPGGLIASLYRVTADGRQILAAQTRASESTGQYVINRRFTGTGRFGFVVRTGQDLQNAPGASNVRSLLVF